MRNRLSRSRARAAAREGRWSRAAAAYAILVARGRATGADRIQIAHALKEAGEADAALDAYRAAAMHYPLMAEAHRQLALFLTRLERMDEAGDAWARAWVADPCGAGDDECWSGDVGLIDRRVQTGLASTPAPKPADAGALAKLMARVALGRARRAARQEDWAGAEREYRTVLRHLPHRGGALVQLGHALAEQGDHAAAVDSYRRALLLRPHDADLHLHTGRALARLGREAGAIAAFLASWRLHPVPGAASEALATLRPRLTLAVLRSDVDGSLLDRIRREAGLVSGVLAPAELPDAYRLHFACLAGSVMRAG